MENIFSRPDPDLYIIDLFTHLLENELKMY